MLFRIFGPHCSDFTAWSFGFGLVLDRSLPFWWKGNMGSICMERQSRIGVQFTSSPDDHRIHLFLRTMYVQIRPFDTPAKCLTHQTIVLPYRQYVLNFNQFHPWEPHAHRLPSLPYLDFQVGQAGQLMGMWFPQVFLAETQDMLSIGYTDYLVS